MKTIILNKANTDSTIDRMKLRLTTDRNWLSSRTEFDPVFTESDQQTHTHTHAHMCNH